jgi:hypothetical protein
MPGLLITPNQYFLNLFDQPKRDFTAWQMNLIHHGLNYVLYAEVSMLVYDKETETLWTRYAWAVMQWIGTEPEVLSGAELTMFVSAADHFGASLENGGCHFEPGLEATTEFALYPPDTLEQCADHEAWRRTKALGLGAAG